MGLHPMRPSCQPVMIRFESQHRCAMPRQPPQEIFVNKHFIGGAIAALAAFNAHALNPGDLSFTSLNADEDGWSLVALVDIPSNTTLFFSDNEYVASAFNTGESYFRWGSGSATIAAGTVIRFSSIDNATLLASSVGTFTREAVALSTNYGVSTTADTVYLFEGSSATAPTRFIAAISNAADGSLAGTGLTEGVNAIRLNSLVPAATPDFGEYTGPRAGQVSFAAYLSAVTNVANWTVDTTNGNYTTTVPNTTAFTISPIPEPQTYAMMLAGLAAVGAAARRRR
jgi:hypothetical protein